MKKNINPTDEIVRYPFIKGKYVNPPKPVYWYDEFIEKGFMSDTSKVTYKNNK